MQTPEEIVWECAKDFVRLLRESNACSVASFEMVEAFQPLTDALAEARAENERLKQALAKCHYYVICSEPDGQLMSFRERMKNIKQESQEALNATD